MKKIFLVLVLGLLSTIASAVVCPPSSVVTPNLGLCEPPHGTPDWDQYYNLNWDLLDSAVGTSTPGGSNGQVQYNNSGSLGADTNFTWDKTTNSLQIGATSPSFDTFTAGIGGRVQLGNGHFFAVNSAPVTVSLMGLAGSEGTLSAPTKLLNTDFFGEIDFYGYGDNGWQYGFAIIGAATGDWTGSTTPSVLKIQGTAATPLWSLDQSGNVVATGKVTAANFLDSGLTASLPICTDGSKNLSSTCTHLIPIADVGSAGLSGTSPVAISAAGAISCATCATTTNGGALSGTSPVAVSAAGAISINNNGITATQLAAQYAILRCYPGLGDGLNAIPAGTYLQTNCYNNSGVTWTITRIGCFTDNSGTSTLNATNGAGTGLLTGAVTCTTAAGGAAGTQSGTTTIANGDVIKFTFVADGTSKQTGWFVTLTQ